MGYKYFSNDLALWGPTVLRIGIGSVFIGAGLQKLLGIWGGAGISGTMALFQAIHLSPAHALAVFVTWLELIGGLLLIIGAFNAWIAGLLVIEMIVAIWKVHLVHGFFLNWSLRPGIGHGYEFNFVLIASLTSLILTGPGQWSIDRWLRKLHERRAS